LPKDAISLFSGSSGIIRTVPGDDGFKVWSPSARRDERIRKRCSQYLCRIDASGHAGIFLVLVLVFMAYYLTLPHPRGAVDLPRAEHFTWLPGAIREDAILVTIARDGMLYFDSRRIPPDELPDQIRSSLRAGAENRIYVSADARAMYRDVKAALAAIRLAEVEHVTFVTESRHQ
jgi:biopolymer transport protein ExbD